VSFDQQFAEHGTEIDRNGPTSGRVLAEARQWLQRHGISELPEPQSVRHPVRRPRRHLRYAVGRTSSRAVYAV
jgi:hypothetical protein